MVTFPWKVFAEKRRLALSYRAIFDRAGGHREFAKIVLADLAIFCRHTSTAADDPEQKDCLDPMALAREEGKRAVYLRIANMLSLSDAEIVEALRAHRQAIAAEIMSVQRQALSGGSGG